MAFCGLEALDKVQRIVAPHKVQEMKFKDVQAAVNNWL